MWFINSLLPVWSLDLLCNGRFDSRWDTSDWVNSSGSIFFFIVCLTLFIVSVTNVLFGLKMATAFWSWLPNPARFGEIWEMFVLREELLVLARNSVFVTGIWYRMTRNHLTEEGPGQHCFCCCCRSKRLKSRRPSWVSRICLGQVKLLFIWDRWGKEDSVTWKSSWMGVVTSFWWLLVLLCATFPSWS